MVSKLITLNYIWLHFIASCIAVRNYFLERVNNGVRISPLYFLLLGGVSQAKFNKGLQPFLILISHC